VSVCGTVTQVSLEAFLGSPGSATCGPHGLRHHPSGSGPGFPWDPPLPTGLAPESSNRLAYLPASPLRSNNLTWFRNLHRMSIAYASRPRLRPDSPDADWPSVGNLRLTANTVLTCFALLMPAFSLLYAPPVLTVRLPRLQNAPLPAMTSRPWLRSFGGRLQPRYIFGAGSL